MLARGGRDTFDVAQHGAIGGPVTAPNGSRRGFPGRRGLRDGNGSERCAGEDRSNRRYPTDLQILDQMLVSGWSFEGSATNKAFACVPRAG
jgi:hypothetical protein